MESMTDPTVTTIVSQRGEKVVPVRKTRDDRELIDKIDACHRESETHRTGATVGLSLVDQWEINGHRFIGNHYSTSGSKAQGLVEGYRVFHFTDSDNGAASSKGLRRATINRVQTAIISNVAGQTQTPPVVRWEPTESMDEPIYWLSRDGASKLSAQVQQAQAMLTQYAGGADMNVMPEQLTMAQQIGGMTFTPGQVGLESDGVPVEPLTREQAAFVQQLLDGGVLTPKDVYIINDRVIADVAQEAFDTKWEQAQADRYVVTNEFLCNIFGSQPMRVYWNHDGPKAHSFCLDNPHILNVWPDPYCDSLDEAEYFIFDCLMSVDRAKATWPEYADLMARAGDTSGISDSGLRHSARWSNNEHQRPMVQVRMAWLRHQPIPLSVEDALERGLIQPAVTEGEPDEMGMVTTTPVMDDDGNPIFQLVEGGELTDPDNENWPTEPGLLECMYLPGIDVLVYSQKCEYMDIPFSWNINVPVPYSIYGQGEPQRLESLQQQINRLMSIFLNYAGYFQAPQRYWKASVLERVRALGFQLHSRPGAEIPIPDADYDRLASQGKMCMVQDIPVLPPQFMQMLEMNLREIDRMAGNVDIRQGIAPSANMSGKALDALRNESYGPIAFKAKYSEWAVERIAKIAMDAMIKWMPIDEWHRVVSRYPLPVLEFIVSRIDCRMMNVRAEISTGRGQTREQEEQRALLLYASGAPGRLISRRTAMERTRVPDPEGESKRIDEENMAAAAAMAPAPTPDSANVTPQ